MEPKNPSHIWILMARKLSGEASSDELNELDQLLREDQHANYSKEMLHDLWESRPVVDSQYTENKYKELVLQIQIMGLDDGKFAQDDHYINGSPEEPAKKSWKKWGYILTGFAVCLCIAAIIFFDNSKVQGKETIDQLAKNEISTRKGSKTKLLLPDGTQVWLNASSKLDYTKDYGNKIREVTLSGEAYFDVVKNTEKPFVIHTSKMDIKVLGTAFNVKCYPGEKTTETSLVRGSIEVTMKDRQEKIMLKPNEKLIINNEEVRQDLKTVSVKQTQSVSQKPIILLSHLTLLQKDNTIIETAWVQNRLIFVSETFEDVALKMERWYSVHIEFANESVKAARLTGNFEKETIVEALNALQFTTKFSYTIKNNIVTIYKYNKIKK